MEKRLTISVAAYNVEKYIDKLMETIIATGVLDTIEVIIVNDGSVDQTVSKAIEYEKCYPQSIRVINKENGGHGSTINVGIEEATGKYFRALDGDDWVCSKNLGKLVDNLPEIDADVILCDFCKCYEDGTETIESFSTLEKGKTYLFDEICTQVGWMRYHSVIYRTSLLKNRIKLDENCFYVDTEFMLFPIPLVNTVYYAKDYVYCYRLGLSEQSVSDKSRMRHVDNSLTVSESLIKYYRRFDRSLSKEKRSYFIKGVAGHCIWYFETLLLFENQKQRKEELVKFDKYVKNNSADIYDEMGRISKKIRLLRVTGYIMYPIIHNYYIKKRTAT